MDKNPYNNDNPRKNTNEQIEQFMKDPYGIGIDLPSLLSLPKFHKYDHILFPVRHIPFPYTKEINGSVGIIAQSTNGPCPLLAIFNALALSGVIQLNPVTTLATAGGIMDLILKELAQRYLAMNSTDRLANKERFLNGARILPSLLNGLDVNVQFLDNEGFEESMAIDLLDFLGIRFFHTWIADPQDTAIIEALGDKTYNDVMDYMTTLGSTNSSSSTTSNTGKNNNTIDNNGSTTLANTSTTTTSFSELELPPLIRTPGTDGNNPNNQGDIPSPVSVDSYFDQFLESLSRTNSTNNNVLSSNNFEPNSPEAELDNFLSRTSTGTSILSTEGPKGPENVIISSTTEVPDPTMTVVSSTVEVVSSTPFPTSPSIGPRVLSALPSDITDPTGLLYQEFIRNSQNQTTFAGIVELRNNLKSFETAVVFRSNHFYTVFKLYGKIYELVTDSGLVQHPGIVWQILEDPFGTDPFVNGYFNVNNNNGSDSGNIEMLLGDTLPHALASKYPNAGTVILHLPTEESKANLHRLETESLQRGAVIRYLRQLKILRVSVPEGIDNLSINEQVTLLESLFVSINEPVPPPPISQIVCKLSVPSKKQTFTTGTGVRITKCSHKVPVPVPQPSVEVVPIENHGPPVPPPVVIVNPSPVPKESPSSVKKTTTVKTEKEPSTSQVTNSDLASLARLRQERNAARGIGNGGSGSTSNIGTTNTNTSSTITTTSSSSFSSLSGSNINNLPKSSSFNTLQSINGPYSKSTSSSSFPSLSHVNSYPPSSTSISMNKEGGMATTGSSHNTGSSNKRFMTMKDVAPPPPSSNTSATMPPNPVVRDVRSDNEQKETEHIKELLKLLQNIQRTRQGLNPRDSRYDDDDDADEDKYEDDSSSSNGNK